MFERLTIRTDICVEPENNIVYNNPNDSDGMYNILDLAECLYNGGEIESSILLKISNRLAAYEDIGKSPEEIISTIEDYKDVSQQYANFVHEMQPLKEAKAEGRLMVLPCKVGDAIWKIKSAFSYFTKPMEDRVERIIIYKNEILVCCTSGAKFSIGSVGKTVFLTCEEAEKALEGEEKRTLNEWAAMDGINILDPDGFDRTDPHLFERLFTREEYNQGIVRCTIMGKEDGKE